MRLWIALLLLAATVVHATPTVVVDDHQRRFTVPATPLRLVSLAPHITDMLVELGVSAQIAGVVDDHEARGAHERSLTGFPVVADSFAVNEERLLALRPDVVIVWAEGTPSARIARLERLGFPVYVMKTVRLSDMASQIERLGLLVGQEVRGRQQAEAFRARLSRLHRQYGAGPRLRYFYQVWRQPLYSLHGGHLLSQALSLCGADNILPPGKVEAPLVAPEFVVAAKPDVIFFGRDDAATSQRYWSRFPSVPAVRQQRLVAVNDARLARPGPALLDAVEPLCRQLQPWRADAKQN